MHKTYFDYYLNQSGGGNSDGDEFGPLFRSHNIFQRGRGIGGAFSCIYRFLKPLFKSGLNYLKNETVQTGLDIIKGINEQKPIKHILTDRSINIVDKIRDNAVQKIKNFRGSGKSKTKTSKRKVIKGFKKQSKIHYKKGNKHDKNKKIKNKKSKQPRILDIF